MPRGRESSVLIRLTLLQRLRLVEIEQQAQQGRGGRVAGRLLSPEQLSLVALRARAVRLRASAVSITDIAKDVGISRRHVYKWLSLYQEEGLRGLLPRQRGRCLP